MSASKDSLPERFIVRPVKGIGLGAGGFAVVDTSSGLESPPAIWLEEAETAARRLNQQYLADMARKNDMPNWGG